MASQAAPRSPPSSRPRRKASDAFRYADDLWFSVGSEPEAVTTTSPHPPAPTVIDALEHAHRVDPWLRAFITDLAPLHRESADETDLSGALSGMPIAVKGIRGLTSPHTRRLQRAGAVPIGGTSVPRGPGYQTWGYTDRGPTRNPWRPDLSPGGSSAGSAAAVAAGIVPLATGSDGAGSLRIPTAWCGIYGYKPTSGPGRAPAMPGALARDPALLRAWADTVLDPLPAASPIRTAAWSADLGYAAPWLDDEVAAIAHARARQLPIALRTTTGPQLRDPQTAWTTARDPGASANELAAADANTERNRAELADLFTDVDLLLTPTTPARPHGHSGPGEHLSVALTWAFNLTGHPAASIPAGFTRDGAPVGLQLIARPHADTALLEFLARYCPPAQAALIDTRPSTWLGNRTGGHR